MTRWANEILDSKGTLLTRPDTATGQLAAAWGALATLPGPHLLAGDYNLRTEEVAPLGIGRQVGDGPTFPAWGPDRRIDHVLTVSETLGENSGGFETAEQLRLHYAKLFPLMTQNQGGRAVAEQVARKLVEYDDFGQPAAQSVAPVGQLSCRRLLPQREKTAADLLVEIVVFGKPKRAVWFGKPKIQYVLGIH